MFLLFSLSTCELYLSRVRRRYSKLRKLNDYFYSFLVVLSLTGFIHISLVHKQHIKGETLGEGKYTPKVTGRYPRDAGQCKGSDNLNGENSH